MKEKYQYDDCFVTNRQCIVSVLFLLLLLTEIMVAVCFLCGVVLHLPYKYGNCIDSLQHDKHKLDSAPQRMSDI